MTMCETEEYLPGNLVVQLRHQLPVSAPANFILSSGYGDDRFSEAAQIALIDVLDRHGIGWVQYVYPERCPGNDFRDMYISTGISTLTWVLEWLQSQSSVRTYLFGYSFGANITLEVSLRKCIAGVVIVNAVFDYVNFRTKQLGDEVMAAWREDRVAFLPYGDATYPLGYRFIQEAQQQELERRAATISCETYAFQAEGDENISPTHILNLAKASRNWHAYIVPGVNADHNFEHPQALAFFVEQIEPFIARLGRNGSGTAGASR